MEAHGPSPFRRCLERAGEWACGSIDRGASRSTASSASVRGRQDAIAVAAGPGGERTVRLGGYRSLPSVYTSAAPVMTITRLQFRVRTTGSALCRRNVASANRRDARAASPANRRPNEGAVQRSTPGRHLPHRFHAASAEPLRRRSCTDEEPLLRVLLLGRSRLTGAVPLPFNHSSRTTHHAIRTHRHGAPRLNLGTDASQEQRGYMSKITWTVHPVSVSCTSRPWKVTALISV